MLTHLVAAGLACVSVTAIDGDGLRATCDGRPMVIRLRDVDAPETRGRCREERALAAKARAAVGALTHAAEVTIWPHYEDRYGRTVATVEVGGLDLGSILLAAGLAQLWPHDEDGRALAPRPTWCP